MWLVRDCLQTFWVWSFKFLKPVLLASLLTTAKVPFLIIKLVKETLMLLGCLSSWRQVATLVIFSVKVTVVLTGTCFLRNKRVPWLYFFPRREETPWKPFEWSSPFTKYPQGRPLVSSCTCNVFCLDSQALLAYYARQMLYLQCFTFSNII